MRYNPISVGRKGRRLMRNVLVILAAMGFFTGNSAFAVDAAALFAAKCAACHGPKGEGTPVGPPQKGNAFVTHGKPDEIKKIITEGRMGRDKKYPQIIADMPRGLVTEAEADVLVKFLQGDLQK
jgi:mono/diheme cytochrome c family protein